jgi:hypothetical protein
MRVGPFCNLRINVAGTGGYFLELKPPSVVGLISIHASSPALEQKLLILVNGTAASASTERY